MADEIDQMLMAYADGKLGAADAARVEMMLARDAGLRRQVEMFRMTGRPLAELFSAPMHEPPPQHLVDLVMRGAARPARVAPTRARTSSPSWLAGLRAGIEQILQPGWQPAMAAVLLALAGVAAGWVAHGLVGVGAHSSDQLVAVAPTWARAEGVLAQVLEREPAGRRVAVDVRGVETVRVEAQLTFMGPTGYCRQYEIAAAGGSAAAGVACRAGDGQWVVQVHTPLAAAASNGADKAKPASARRSLAVEAVVRSLMSGDALEADAEGRAIGNGWRRP